MLAIAEIGKRLSEAGRLKMRPLCVCGAGAPPEGAVPSTAIDRCIAKAIYACALFDETPAIYVGGGLENCCMGGQKWLGYAEGSPLLKYFVTVGTREFRGGAAEHLKATPEIFEEQTQRAGKITPPGEYVVISPCSGFLDDGSVRSLLLFGGCEQIRNLSALAAFHSSDPFYQVLVNAGPTCATMVTFPAGMAANAPKGAAFVGPTDPTGNIWFPPDLMVMGIPVGLAQQMAADVDSSFIGKRGNVAYPERRIAIKPLMTAVQHAPPEHKSTKSG